METPQGYLIDQRTAERLKRVLPFVEMLMAQKPNLGGERPNWQFVKVTGAISGDYYPGVVVIWDSAAAALTTLGTCWLRDITDAELETDDYVAARQSGLHTITADTRPVFISAAIARGSNIADSCLSWEDLFECEDDELVPFDLCIRDGKLVRLDPDTGDPL